MKAILVIQTHKGFAIAPYTGSVPENFVESMSMAKHVTSYSYPDNTVATVLEEFFAPPAPVVVKLKEAA